MATLPQGKHILSGVESQRLRSFCSSAVWNSSHLDAYAILLQNGPLSLVKADFQQRIDSSSLEEARNALAALTYGPGKLPLYNYLLQLIFINTASRELYMSIVSFLAEEAKVPVDTPDLSGTTTLMWAISTKPYYEPEVADILLKAEGNINRRNRYGCVAAHDAAMVRDYTPAGKKKTCDALKYYVEHGGDMDIACGDGTTPREIAKKIPRHPGLQALLKSAAFSDRTGADVPKCATCGLAGNQLLTCSKCNVRRYCDQECQRNEWKLHKKTCTKSLS